jgi:hypothetical protein
MPSWDMLGHKRDMAGRGGKAEMGHLLVTFGTSSEKQKLGKQPSEVAGRLHGPRKAEIRITGRGEQEKLKSGKQKAEMGSHGPVLE